MCCEGERVRSFIESAQSDLPPVFVLPGIPSLSKYQAFHAKAGSFLSVTYLWPPSCLFLKLTFVQRGPKG
jgi:hypothetical protein